MKNHPVSSRARGFTLLELLIVIAIIAILAALGFTVFQKSTLKARQVQTASLGRSVGTGISMFMAETMRPPNPPTKDGDDTIYGDPGGLYSTAYLVGVLTGEEVTFTEGDGTTANSLALNPQRNKYVDLPIVDNNVLGVGAQDGRIYDAWGRELMFAINSRVVDAYENPSQPGKEDRVLHSYGLLDYTDVGAAGERPWAFISMGADGLKGREKSENLFNPNVRFAGSDDVISW